MNNDRNAISWVAPEYRAYEKSSDWFWAVGIIGAAGSATAIIVGNILFGVFLGIGVATLLLQSLRRPRLVEFRVDERGVAVEKAHRLWSEFRSFWIAEDGAPELLLKPEKLFTQLFVLPLPDDVDTEALRDFLLDFLDEEELHEPAGQKIMEYLGF